MYQTPLRAAALSESEMWGINRGIVLIGVDLRRKTFFFFHGFV